MAGVYFIPKTTVHGGVALGSSFLTSLSTIVEQSSPRPFVSGFVGPFWPKR
jgi:acyl-CoA thioesterase